MVLVCETVDMELSGVSKDVFALMAFNGTNHFD
jgi:hypothetical protein